jgi:hypothetical protein
VTIASAIAKLSTQKHKTVTAVMVAATILVAALAVGGTLVPALSDWLNPIRVDTDPENMLAYDEPVRVFHREMKDRLALHDMVVVGIVNEQHEQGVFNPLSLRKVYEITEYARTFTWPEPTADDPNHTQGVIQADLIAPSAVDNIIPGQGMVRFEWLMPQPPATQAQAAAIRDHAMRIPMFKDTMVSHDGKAVALYLPLSEKDVSSRVYDRLRDQMETLWLWAEVHHRMISAQPADEPNAPSDEQMRAVETLGRLLAHQADDREQFETLMTVLSAYLADGSAAEKLSAAAEAVQAVEVEAIDADLDAEAAWRAYRDRADQFRSRLAEQANAKGSAMEYIASLRAAARTDSFRGVEALKANVVEFMRRMSASLAGPADWQPIASVVTPTMGRSTGLAGPEAFHITGLPVAEDVFGVEMFIQMAISAPAAMLVIFVLMLAFFRKLVIVISPMIVAMVSVIFTMGALVIAGYPIHIMSSMIPIFIMPIAVLDSIHIISEFFELYQKTRDRAATIREVMDELFTPMLYTSLTSAAGFASLALTPIPPVQVFGVFVALGIMVAWLLTVVFIPSFVMFIPPASLENFGATHDDRGHNTARQGLLGRLLHATSQLTYRQAKPILAATLVVLVVAGWGISQIVINDNPVKWFDEGHDIRVADQALNEHFAGTYMAYLAFEAEEETFDPNAAATNLADRADKRLAKLVEQDYAKAPQVFEELTPLARQAAADHDQRDAWFDALDQQTRARQRQAEDADDWELADAWNEAGLLVSELRQANELFKDPEVLRYLRRFQDHMDAHEVVGKTNSLPDIVMTVYRDLLSGDPNDFRIPDSSSAVAQTLEQYRSSHRPQDLWHFVTPDYRTSSLWFQLTSGDNRDMTAVVQSANRWLEHNPPPAGLASPAWFGLTYINVVWQEKMVAGMLNAFAGSFLVVLVLMTILFRSALWGLLSMIPLTVTIAAIYGAIGIIGKNYDMPVAVLSSLTLGLAVDFAIHFLARSRAAHQQTGSWESAAGAVFAEPARAIMRNIIVIATGFLPLLLAPLVPYQTVGILMATILLVSGIATLLILPAMIRVLARWLFPAAQPMGTACNCVTCGVSSLAVVAFVALTIHSYWPMHWTTLTWVALVGAIGSAVLCGLMSRRRKCQLQTNSQEAAS